MTILERLEQHHPGVESYLVEAMAGLGCGKWFDLARPRLLEGLERVGFEAASAACREWERLGILPEARVETAEQVAAVWRNPVFQALMDDALGFTPPRGVNLLDHVPPRLDSFEALAQRRQQVFQDIVDGCLAREANYWSKILGLQAPELYLEPWLRRSVPLKGCDLACGWGRITLTLPRYADRTIHAVDLTTSSLDRLSDLASRAGLSQHIVPTVGDVLQLPFEKESFDFFLAFDIFEHLNDEALKQSLREILRCARPKAILYAEIPLYSKCLPLTHLQDFTAPDVVERFHSLLVDGKTFRLLRYEDSCTDQFSFAVLEEKDAYPLEGSES